MKKQGILNPELSRAIAELGHNDMILIGDAGMPIPEHVHRIDLSLVAGIPLVEQICKALEAEIVVERIVLAEETDSRSPKFAETMNGIWPNINSERVTHEELKKMMDNCRFVIRSGEFTPYANVLLVSGVPF